MVKAKKGNKAGEDTNEDTSPSGSVVAEPIENMDDSDSGTIERMEAKKKEKRAKKEVKKVKPASDSEEDDVVPAPSKGGFALLMDDDDSDPPSPEQRISDDDDDDIPAPATQKSKAVHQEKGGKKSKKSKRNKDEDDEDLEKVLAELELEYSGQKPKEPSPEEKEMEEKKEAKKAKKKEKRKEAAAAAASEDLPGESEETSEVTTAKTANQKKKDKKKDKKREKKEDTPDETQNDENEKQDAAEDEDEEEDADKKGKKKKKGKDDKGKDLKGPGKKTIVAMQEALKKLKEEEERLKREEEEKIRQEEEAERQRQEAVRLEKERKEKKKQKEKERKERMKAEGRLLTAKQKQDKLRAQELINSLKAQGLELPEPGEKKVRPGTRVKPYKKPSAAATTSETQPPQEPTAEECPAVEVVIVDQSAAPAAPEVKDAWDAESSEEENEETTDQKAPSSPSPPPAPEIKTEKPATPLPKQESEEKPADSSDESSEDDSSDEEEEEEKKTEAEKKRERALARIQKRKEDAEKKRTLENLRAAVVCVLGHVDTGKTKILDKLRRTNVQVGEAGGITQQIGATNVPMDNIKEACKLVKGFSEMELKLPGLLIIDTPGHESFSNLRSRGSSLCDIAILVVDIMHGLEPQTLESINLLKTRKTPFIVALNKIDRLYNWQTMGRKDIRDIMKAQAENTQLEFDQRTKEVVLQFAEQGLNAALFYDSPDLRSYVSLVPTSAITGEGMGNLLCLIVEFCQTLLAKRLMYSELLQATVLEVKAIPGLGTTIDCILINGKLAEGDTIILAGTDGPVVTQIRSLLMPQPMKELRVKNAYIEYKEIKAAQGVKIAGKDLEKSIAGLNLQVAEKPDEVDIYCEEVARELKSALSNIKLRDRGVYVQASTLGSLEALLEFLRTSKIPVANIRIGPVVKKDVMKASTMLEHESQYATILAFDVKIERDAQELADSLGVKIFQADIIYHLFDKFMAYREELRMKKRDEFKNIAVFPCKLRILPQFVFNARDPIVAGVIVEAGVIKEGTPICVPDKDFAYLGVVTSLEQNHKPVEVARKGMEVCIKIENTTGDAPKLYGRHFDHNDILTSKISRQSIDACKDYFRDDLTKTDWQLMVELKKLFQIM